MTSKIVDIYVGPDSTHWPLHERLLCYHSKFFSNIFYKDETSRGNKSYGLPDDDDAPFELLVGWLYSKAIKSPKAEKDIGPLLELYLLSQKFEMDKLAEDVVETIREWYHDSNTYPSMRRVQYIYAETDEDNEMREMMVSSIARQLTTSDKIPLYWAQALQRNGQLAVDIIRSIQQWHIEERSIPDARDLSMDRGRKQKNTFSAVEREGGDSTETTETADTKTGVDSTKTDSEAPQKSEGEE